MCEIISLSKHKHSGVMRRLTSFFTMVVIAMSGAGQSACSAAETFEIERQVLLKEGSNPNRIVRVEDGYIIVGSGKRGGIAIKTDKLGNQKWSYVLPQESGLTRPYEWPVFTGVVPLKNGDVLVCGHHHKAGEGTRSRPSVGLLIKLDNRGSVLDKRELFPQKGLTTKIGRIENCVSIGDGIVVLGQASTMSPGNGKTSKEKIVHYLLGLNSSGEFQWEKALQSEAWLPSYGLPITLSEGGAIIPIYPRNSGGTHLIRINSFGDILAERIYSEKFYSILSLQPERNARLLAQKPTKSPTTLMVTLDKNLQELSRAQIKINIAFPLFRLADGSYVRFGMHRKFSGELVASVQRVEADLMDVRESFLKPKVGVIDAIPTNTPGAFATVRQILRGFDDRTSVEEGSGIGFEIIKIK